MIPQHESEGLDDWDIPEDLLSRLVPEERIGAPVSRGRRWMKRVAVLTLLSGAGFAVQSYDPALYLTAATKALAVADAALHPKSAAESTPAPLITFENLPSASAPVAPAAQEAQEQLPVRAVAEAPPVMATAYTPEAEAEAEPATTTPEQKAARVRAREAGLGPDLPNVLLTRLSKADLENAAYVIKTALAKTADDAKTSWPPKPTAKQALFEVRFVAGAPDGCRRYVVTVTKERWSTTSGAVEKCHDKSTH